MTVREMQLDHVEIWNKGVLFQRGYDVVSGRKNSGSDGGSGGTFGGS